MSLLIALAVMAAPAPTGFTDAVERLPLVKAPKAGKLELTVDALLREIIVTGASGLKGPRGTLCPRSRIDPRGLVLSCSSRKLWGTLIDTPAGPVLEVRLLKCLAPGPPDERTPATAYTLSSLNIPESCPGESFAAKAECLWATGQYSQAEPLYMQALGGADTGVARLRLGDLLAWRGEWEKALSQYVKISPNGPIGRMAVVRACELAGSCLDQESSDVVGITDGLTNVMRNELILSNARRQLVMGEDARAERTLLDGLAADASLCDGAPGLCQKLVAAGLASDDDDVRTLALEAFLAPTIRKGPFLGQLLLLGADASVRAGAPGFAANLLAAATPTVPAAALSDHLLRAAQLYLEARDTTRAEVLLDYAGNRSLTRGPKWQLVKAVVERAKPRAAPADDTKETAASPPSFEEVAAQAMTDLSRVTVLRSRALTIGGDP